MKKARGKAAAKHNMAKVAAKVAANSGKTNDLQETINACNQENVQEAAQEVQEMETKTEVIIQYRHEESDLEQVIQRVKEDFAVRGNRGVAVEKIQIYVKPEDYTAYYVINDDFAGKVSLF